MGDPPPASPEPAGQDLLSHAGLVRRYRLPIAGTLALLALENGLAIAIPYVLGLAIDGLIAGRIREWNLFLAVSVATLAIAVARRVYDTRLYARIYREVGDETAGRELARGAGIAQVTARVNFVKDFTDFFEIMLPAALISAFMLAGSAAMLAVISPTLGLATLVVAALVALIFIASRKRIQRLNASLNDEMERQVDQLRELAARRTAHFHALSSWRIALSNLEARNFGVVQALTTLLVAGALVQLIWFENSSEGQVFAALTYLLQFSQAAILLPFTYQEYLRTSEIAARLSKAVQAAPDEAS